LWEERKQGGHALRVLQFYTERYWQAEAPELAFLQLLGLFDRPMTLREKEVLVSQAECAQPLRALDDVGWELLERHLEEAGLLLKAQDEWSSARIHWDCHPLIRDYFGQRFQNTQLHWFRQAHHVLFEYYQVAVPSQHQLLEYHRTAVPSQPPPDTLEDLEPLYPAVVHGCLAGEYQKAFDVYKRIESRYRSIDRFGAYSQTLTVLATFFPQDWSHPVQQDLSEAAQAWLLATVSFCLCSLGRLKEAVEPRVAHLNLSEKLREKFREEQNQEANLENFKSVLKAPREFATHWGEFFMATQNLVDLYLLLGQLSDAEKIAHQAIHQYERDELFDRFVEINNHLFYATVLHRQGKLNQALQLFQKAEQVIQEKEARERVGWHSFYLFLYCPLLLDLAQSVTEYETISEKVVKLFFDEKGELSSRVTRSSVASIWFDCLTFARVLSRLQYDENADYHFNQAVDGIRNAGNIDFLPEFLIDRANFHLRSSRLNLDTAHHDLQEADSLIRRCRMKLYDVDCQLAWCRYYLKREEKEKARTCWQKAKDLIAITGYHLRDKDLKQLSELELTEF